MCPSDEEIQAAIEAEARIAEAGEGSAILPPLRSETADRTMALKIALAAVADVAEPSQLMQAAHDLRREVQVVGEVDALADYCLELASWLFDGGDANAFPVGYG